MTHLTLRLAFRHWRSRCQSPLAWRWQLFTMASLANHLLARFFLGSPKRWNSLVAALRLGDFGPPPPTNLMLLAPSDYCLSGSMKKHWLASDMRWRWYEASCHLQATNIWHWFLLLRDRACVGATVGQVLKCQWWLCGGLMGIVCYSCFLHTGGCI